MTAQAAQVPAPSPGPVIVNLPVLRRGVRIFLFYSCAFVLTGVVSLMFADLLWRTGWSTSRTVLLVLFIILFLLAAIGCVHGIFGFLLRVSGDKRTQQIVGDAAWTLLEHEFEVMQGGEDKELVCELRARQGEVWFDAASLRLIRGK